MGQQPDDGLLLVTLDVADAVVLDRSRIEYKKEQGNIN